MTWRWSSASKALAGGGWGRGSPRQLMSPRSGPLFVSFGLRLVSASYGSGSDSGLSKGQNLAPREVKD